MNQVKYIHTSANACCSVSKNKNIVLRRKSYEEYIYNEVLFNIDINI